MYLLRSANEGNEICLAAGQIACQGGISVNNFLPVAGLDELAAAAPENKSALRACD